MAETHDSKGSVVKRVAFLLFFGLLALAAVFMWPRLRAEYAYLQISRDPLDYENYRPLRTLGEAATPVLLRVLNHPEPLARRYAIEVLAGQQDIHALTLLIDVAERDENALVRDEAIGALGAIGDVKALPALERMSVTNERAVEALAQLGAMGEQTLVSIFRNADNAEWRRAKALAVLCEQPVADTDVRSIVRNALIEPSDEIAVQAVRCSTKVFRGAEAEVLTPILKRESPATRVEAAYELARLGNRAGLSALSQILLDETLPSVPRARAAWALHRVGGELAAGALQQATMAKEPFIQEQAKLFLRSLQLSGRDTAGDNTR